MATDESIKRTIDDLMKEIGVARAEIGKADNERNHALNELRGKTATLTDTTAKLDRISADITARVNSLQGALNSLAVKMGRPSLAGGDVTEEAIERKSAYGMLETRHRMRIQKHSPEHPFSPTDAEIDEALLARAAIKRFFKTTSIDAIPLDMRKALSSFSVGTSGFILPPEMSGRVLSCLEDKTDVAGIVGSINISGPSIKFLIDNAEISEAAWACQTDCFANNPGSDIVKGLGELEIKPEALRFIVCTSRDILEDASVDMESWMLRKV